MVYSTRRFVLSLALCFLFVCFFILAFFSPFCIAITSLGEKSANLSAFRTFVQFALVWFCLFPLPVGVWEGLWHVTVAFLGLFSFPFLDSLPTACQRLNHFHISCLRKLLKIEWQDRIPDKGPEKGRDAECTHSSEIGTIMIGRPCHQNSRRKRLPNKVLYGELQVGKRSYDGQKKRYKDTHKYTPPP